jgi:3',5'-cyclic AMP phosphodiesterase CpdA
LRKRPERSKHSGRLPTPLAHDEGASIHRHDSPTVRLAHFSDIHVTAPGCPWRTRDWFNKRMSAWINLRVLGRGQRFGHGERILSALREEVRQRNYHRLVFSGDATAMGFAEEMRRAAELLGVGDSSVPGLAVPGNHDYCTTAAMHGGCFERSFAPWQVGERVGEEIYPFAQRVGPSWLIGVNSATANRLYWDARGRAGVEQLERLRKLLATLEAGPRILVTHYPINLADGRPEQAYHGLRDLSELLSVAAKGGVVLWLHGHRHHPYHHLTSEYASFPAICAGSLTQEGAWSYGDYSIEGNRLRAVQRVFDEADGSFRDGRTFEVCFPR